MADNVEIRITGTVDSSLGGSTAAAAAQLDTISAASARVNTNLKASAEAFAGIGSPVRSARDSFAAFTEQGAELNAIFSASEGAKMQRAAQDLEAVGAATEHGHGAASTATREFRALFDELSSGRTRQTPGTLAIIGQRVFGLGATALVTVGAVAALTAGLGYLAYRAIESATALDKAKEAADFSGNTGLGKQQLQAAITALDDFAGVSKKDAQEVVEAFAHMRDMSAPELDALSRLVGEYAETQGVKAPEAAKIFIQALDNENLSAKELAKIIPSITQAQIDNIEKTQQMGDTHRTAAALLSVLGDALQRTAKDWADERAGMFSSFSTFGAYLGLLEAGESIQQIHTELVNDNTAAWNKNHAALLADLDALRNLANAPKLADIEGPLEKARDSIAHLDSTWKGSTAGRYAAEARLWQEIAAGTDLNTKQRAEANRNADEAIFHSHEATQREIKTADKQAETEERKNQNAGIQAAVEDERKMSSAVEAAHRDTVNTDLQLMRMRYAAAKQELDDELAAHRITAEEKYAVLVKLAQETANLEIEELERQKMLHADDVEAYTRYANEILRIRGQLNVQLAQLGREETQDHRRENRERETQYRTMVSELGNAEDQLVNDIFTKNQSLMADLAEISLQLLEKEIANDLKYYTTKLLYAHLGMEADTAAAQGGVLVHLLGETQKTAGTVAGETTRLAVKETAQAAGGAADVAAGSASIINDAYKSAAGAYSAVVGIPIIGPILAPIAAGTAFAAVAAFDTLTSFDVGTNYVPQDMVAKIHKGERIVPAADNEQLLDAAGGGSRGDTYNFHALDAKSVLALFKANPDAFAAGARSAAQRLKRF